MNRTYRSIWNNKREILALKSLAASVMLAFGSSVYALPVDGVVSAGSASIASSAGSMTINQASQNVAINWQSFSIGSSEAVRFVQPNSSSVALNRVLGSDPSSILGSLSANGKVFIVNPNGVLFAKGAQVNVGGLVASTRGISDSDFMAGNYKFSGTGGGTVVNQGSISADGGYVALLGASVSNEGVISARLGTVALAAGNAMTLDVAGDGLLSVAVNQGAVNALVQNGGLIQADGGQVLLTALSASNLLQSAVNNTGIIQAQTAENHNGTIRLLGDMQNGLVSVSGTLDASGTGAGQTGGNVTVTGQHVGLFNGHINASGDAGGGTVLVGGGFQGNNPAVQNASATYMSADSTISADAITNGNGGTAVLWANDSTRARGSITARGGAQGGDGGLIETSAHWLDVVGIKVNAGAPNGKPGTWLLDPADVTIGPATANEDTGGNNFTPSTNAAAASVDIPALILALTNGNVTINTVNNGISGGGNGDITVLASFAMPTTNTLTLNAVRNITVNPGADITDPGGGDLTMKAGGNVILAGAITLPGGNLVVCCGSNIDVRGAITTTDGSILLSGSGTVTVDAAITATRGNLTICAGVDVAVNQKITVTDGSVIAGVDLGLTPGLVLSAGNAATGPGAAGGGGSVFIPPPLDPLRPTVDTTATNITYNPVSYSAPLINYVIAGTGSAPVVRRMVFPDGADRTFVAGSTVANFTSFKPDINGLVPANITLAGAGSASFATPDVGNNKIVTFSGFTLAGADAALFALPGTVIPLPVDPARADCCGGGFGRTTGDITATTSGGTTSPTVQPMPLLPVGLPLIAGLNLDIGGITMPPIVVAEIPAVEAAPLSAFTDTPVVELPVPPVLPRKPDRN